MQSILSQLFQSPFFSAISLACVLLFLYSTYATYVIFFKSVKTDRQIKTLGKTSSIWHLHDINLRVKTVFQTLQTACQQDKPALLSDIMTQHLFAHYELTLQNLDDQNIKEVIKHVKLHSFSVVSVQKNESDIDDVLWVYMYFSKTDFEINREDESVVEGHPGLAIHYKQLWKFELENNQWKLALIRENVHLSHI